MQGYGLLYTTIAGVDFGGSAGPGRAPPATPAAGPAGPVPGAWVVADELPGMQGLLGVSFLSRFTVHMDPHKGVLEISARAPAAKGGAGSK